MMMAYDDRIYRSYSPIVRTSKLILDSNRYILVLNTVATSFQKSGVKLLVWCVSARKFPRAPEIVARENTVLSNICNG